MSFMIYSHKTGKCKVGPKVLILGPSLFHKNSNPSKIFQIMFLFARVPPLVRISIILYHIWGVRVQKPSKKGHFMDAILMKHTTIMCFHESVK